MRDRLRKLIDLFVDNEEYRESDLTDYLLENGVIVPPCKVGQKVYCIIEGLDGVVEGHIRQFMVTEEIFLDCVMRGYFNQVFHISNIGKTVFLTREEAEAALKERERG